MNRNNNTLGCISIIVFCGSLYISVTTHFPLFGYLMIIVFAFIFLVIIFDIFSSDISNKSAKINNEVKQNLNAVNIDYNNLNPAKFSKTNHQTSKNTKKSVTNIIIWIFIIFCFVTCASRHRVGAICNDGSTSSSTGSGTCSHHDGVSRWKYEYWWD